MTTSETGINRSTNHLPSPESIPDAAKALFLSRAQNILDISGSNYKLARHEQADERSQLPSIDESTKRLMGNASYITGVELPGVSYTGE